MWGTEEPRTPQSEKANKEDKQQLDPLPSYHDFELKEKNFHSSIFNVIISLLYPNTHG